jgi:hypothetical protein
MAENTGQQNRRFTCDASGCGVEGEGIGGAFPEGWLQVQRSRYVDNPDGTRGAQGEGFVFCELHSAPMKLTVLEASDAAQHA